MHSIAMYRMYSLHVYHVFTARPLSDLAVFRNVKATIAAGSMRTAARA